MTHPALLLSAPAPDALPPYALPARLARAPSHTASTGTLVRCLALSLLVSGAAATGGRAQTAALDAERNSCAVQALGRQSVSAVAGTYRAHQLISQHDTDPAAPERFLRRVFALSKSPLARAHAQMLLALAQQRAGDLRGAQRAYRDLGIVPEILAVGPFANLGGGGFGGAGPVNVVAPTIDGLLPGSEGAVAFQQVALSPSGTLDIGAQQSVCKETRAFAIFVAQSRVEQTLAMRAGSSGQLRVIVNGAQVIFDNVDRVIAFDQSVAAIHLRKGDNLVVVEVGFLSSRAEVRLRLTALDGSAARDVTTTTSAASIASASTTAAFVVANAPAVAATLPAVVDAVHVSATAANLAARVNVERYLHASDTRVRPTAMAALLQQLVDSAPTPATLALALARQGADRVELDPTAARESLQRALTLDPDCLPALLELAQLRADQSLPHLARPLLLRAAKVFKTSDLAMYRFLEFRRRNDNAGIVVDDAVISRAQMVPTERNLEAAADVFEQRGNTSAARALLSASNDAQRKITLDLELAKADLVHDAGARGRTIELLRRQLALRPASHDVAQSLTLTLQSAGLTTQADAVVSDRIRVYGQRAEPYQLQATLALLRNERPAAVAAVSRALDRTPQDEQLQALRRALDTSDSLVDRFSVDLNPLAQLPPAADATDIGAEVLANTTAILLYDNGLARIMTDRVYRVVDADKARGLEALSYDYTDGRETLDILVAQRVGENGRTQSATRVYDNRPQGKTGGMYTDGVARIVEFAGLQNGDIVHVKTRKELVGQQNLFGDFFGTIEPIRTGLPTRNWRLIIDTPRNKALYWGGRGAPEPAITENGERLVYTFNVDSAAALKSEPQAPPFFARTDFVSVSTYATWQALGTWYESLAAPQLTLNDELRGVAKAQQALASDRQDLVRRLYEYVVTQTRYVGIELGIHGWKPYPVTEVHRRRYGDCKDKASLLVALLREAGVPADIALVRTANLGALPVDPPTMWAFNHAIAYVPEFDRFLDATAEQSGWRELPAMDQGAQTLVVAPGGASRLAVIAVLGADSNENLSDYVLTLDASGSLSVRGKERFSGEANAQQRREFADPAKNQLTLQRHMAASLPGNQVHSVTMTDLSLSAERLGYDFTSTIRDRAVREQNGALLMPLSLYAHDLAGNFADTSTRTSDLFIDHPWRTRNIMRYVLPAGFGVVELPTGGVVNGKHLTFVQRIERTVDGFIVDEDTAVLSRLVPAADYAQFRNEALRADSFMKKKIRVTRSAP